MNKKLTLSVAIAAYNAENNIKRLTEAILSQEERSFILEKIIINSDSSTDNTVKIARTLKDKRVRVIDSNLRSGFAGVIISLVNSNKSDVLLILNDDIILKDKLFLEKIVDAFLNDPNVGLVCCNAQALESNIFVSEAVRSGYNVYKNIGDYINNGNNVFTVDGKALGFSKKLMSSIEFPEDKSEMANVDKYVYFSSKLAGLNYVYVKKAVMHFKCPSTIKDFVKWQIRNYKTNNYIMPAKFGDIAEQEYKFPRRVFNYYKFIEFLKNPLGSIFILFLGFYCSYASNKNKYSFNKTWDLVISTKEL